MTTGETVTTEKLPRKWPKGTWKIVLEHEDGTVEVIGPKTNDIVINGKILMAALMKNDALYPNGIQYLAVGSGDSDWDTQGTPDPSFANTTLLDEVDPGGRKVPESIVYLDGPAGSPTLTPSAIIQVKTRFEKTDLPAGGVYIREYGLFGGNATSVKDSGLMFNVLHTSRVWKNNLVVATFYITIEF